MKELRLVYDPASSEERAIFSNIGMHNLTDPLTIRREEPVQEEEQEFGKKKSEVIDYEDERYQALKEKEQLPYIVTDGESRTYSGKLQDISDSSSAYFAFVNMGTYLKMVPISKWYGFVQKNHFADGNVETLEKSLNAFEFFEEDRSQSGEGIDYEAEFDDDDGDEQTVEIVKEKHLTTSGKELQGLVDIYGENDGPPESPKDEEPPEGLESKRVKKEAALTKEELRRIFGGGRISVKDLLKAVKANFRLDEAEKAMIREFIHESCTFETDSVTGEKMFKLRK